MFCEAGRRRRSLERGAHGQDGWGAKTITGAPGLRCCKMRMMRPDSSMNRVKLQHVKGRLIVPVILTLFVVGSAHGHGGDSGWASATMQLSRSALSHFRHALEQNRTTSTHPPTESSADLEKWLASAIRELLLSSAFPNEEFRGTLAATPIEFREMEGAGSGAIHRFGKIQINSKALPGLVMQLTQQGVPSEQVPSILAVQYLSIIAHEVQHAVNARHVQGFGQLEEEFSAFVTEIIAIREVRKAHLDAFRFKTYLTHFDDRLLESWATSGPAGLLDFTKWAYPQKNPIGSAEAERGVAEAEAKHKPMLPKLNDLIRRCAEDMPGSEDRCLDQNTGGYLKDRIEADAFVAWINAMVSRASPQGLRDATSYYERENRRAQQLWKDWASE